MRAGRNWFRLVPAHCAGEHFAITDGRRFGWWQVEEPVLKLAEVVGAFHCQSNARYPREAPRCALLPLACLRASQRLVQRHSG